MGGMGITRSFSMLADQFAFFMPLAAGMDLSYLQPADREWQLNKAFNVPYIHLQGLRDHFDVFITRCKEQLKLTMELEKKYGLKSMLNMVFYDTDHNYDFDTFKSYLNNAFQNPRKLYQKELFGSIRTASAFAEERGYKFHWGSVPRYFWVEAMNSDLTKPDGFNFHARIENNDVHIDLMSIPAATKKLRVYLHSQMLDLNQAVAVIVNGTKVATRDPQIAHAKLRSIDPTDAAFQYEDYIDIAIPQKIKGTLPEESAPHFMFQRLHLSPYQW